MDDWVSAKYNGKRLIKFVNDNKTIIDKAKKILKLNDFQMEYLTLYLKQNYPKAFIRNTEASPKIEEQVIVKDKRTDVELFHCKMDYMQRGSEFTKNRMDAYQKLDTEETHDVPKVEMIDLEGFELDFDQDVLI